MSGSEGRGVERALQLEAIFEHAENSIFIVDPAHDRYVDVNRAACAFLGYERDELLATPLSDIHPAEMPQLTAWSRTAVERGQAWSAMFTCKTKAGEFRPAEMEFLVPDRRGYVFAFVVDRSEHPTRRP